MNRSGNEENLYWTEKAPGLKCGKAGALCEIEKGPLIEMSSKDWKSSDKSWGSNQTPLKQRVLLQSLKECHCDKCVCVSMLRLGLFTAYYFSSIKTVNTKDIYTVAPF